MSKPVVVTPADYKPALNVLGSNVTVLAEGKQNITLQVGEEGVGPPPHEHPWDEAFFVMKGTVEFTCGGEVKMCASGSLVQIPAGTVHSFRYAAGGGEMLEMTGEGSRAVPLFAQFDREMPPGAPDVEKAVEIMVANGVTVRG